MSDQVTVTGAQLESLVGKLEAIRGDLTPDESSALDALVALAGDGLAGLEPEVAGFGGGLWSGRSGQVGLNFSTPTDQNNQGVLIGLLRNGSTQLQDFHFSHPMDKSTP